LASFKVSQTKLLNAIVPLKIRINDNDSYKYARSGSFKELELLSSGHATFVSGYDYANTFKICWCCEHGRYELVPSANYWRDMSYWYDAGIHPRFSIKQALRRVTNRCFEVLHGLIMKRVPVSKRDFMLRHSRTQNDFIRLMRPYLFVNLYHQGRRYRVLPAFKEKFLAKSFTVGDFFKETNQELRRLILRRGLNIQKVLKGMKLVMRDSEGMLLDMQKGGGGRYLYVKCPSTNQEYLIGVPRRFDSPSAARRWTFNLPNDAVFAKEA
jgi:hypothetical protein